jgi:hypothetical protein
MGKMILQLLILTVAGTGLVNFGHALVNNDAQLFANALWLVALVTGGLVA